jgi:cephalosporin-C deacetylase-like acetyl esterase
MASLFYAPPLRSISTCVVFLHGYGSNRLECSNLLPFIQSQQLALCSLDFSGSGKSQGDTVTYGIK